MRSVDLRTRVLARQDQTESPRHRNPSSRDHPVTLSINGPFGYYAWSRSHMAWGLLELQRIRRNTASLTIASAV